MVVYVNWDERKILSETEKDERIAEIFNEFAHDTDMMDDFLRENGNEMVTDTANGDDVALELFRKSYKDYVEKEATGYFFDDYEEIEIGD